MRDLQLTGLGMTAPEIAVRGGEHCLFGCLRPFSEAQEVRLRASWSDLMTHPGRLLPIRLAVFEVTNRTSSSRMPHRSPFIAVARGCSREDRPITQPQREARSNASAVVDGRLRPVDRARAGYEAVILAHEQAGAVRQPCRDTTSSSRRGDVIYLVAHRHVKGDAQRLYRGGNSSKVRKALFRTASAVSNLPIAVRATVM